MRFTNARGEVCCEAADEKLEEDPTVLCSDCLAKWAEARRQRSATTRVREMRTAGEPCPCGQCVSARARAATPQGEPVTPPPSLSERLLARRAKPTTADAHPRILKYLRARLSYDHMTD